jgi:hypothetical protein
VEPDLKLEILEIRNRNLTEKLERTINQAELCESDYCQVKKEIHKFASSR